MLLPTRKQVRKVGDMGGRVGHTTAAQSDSAAVIAAERSEPVQVFSMQAAVPETKVSLLQRQASSVAAQPPMLAEAIHVPAQTGSQKDGSIR